MAGALGTLPTARLAALRARLSDDELRNFPTTRDLLVQVRDALEAPDAVALLDCAALPANEAELLTFLSRDRCAHAPATSCAHGPWQFRGVLPKSLDGLLSQQQDDEVYIKNDSELLKRQGSRPLTVSDWAKQVERVRGRRAPKILNWPLKTSKLHIRLPEIVSSGKAWNGENLPHSLTFGSPNWLPEAPTTATLTRPGQVEPDFTFQPKLQLVAGDDFTPFHVDNEGPAVYFKLCFGEVLVATWDGEEGESIGMVDGGGTKDDENAWDGAKWAALRSAQLLWLRAGDVMLMPSSVVHLVITLKTKLVVAGDILTAANFERAVWADDTFRRTAKTKVPSEMGKRLDEGAEWLLTRLGAAQVPLALRGRAVERMLGLLAADSDAESRRPKAERRTDQKSIEKRARLVAILGEWQRFLRRAAAAPSGAEWRFGSTNDAAVRRYSADVDEHEATAVDESHPAAAAAAMRRQAKRKRGAGV